MPCSPSKAGYLLRSGKAEVANRTPFTIKLKYGSIGYVQPVTLGVDTGYKNAGLSAVTAKKELYSAEVTLRDDIVKLNSERRTYRRSRRGRKTWYRQPRFDNRKKDAGWLAPSIQHKLDSHVKLVDRVKAILPVARTVVEVAAFDIQKIKNPEISGTMYQNGKQTGFWNVREYVLHRDGHKCQAPSCSHKDPVLHVHHVESRQTGGDRPGNLVTLCDTCHGRHHRGEITLAVRASRSFKAETFMSMVWRRLADATGAETTFGYLTKSARAKVGMPKSHRNDAFCVAGGTDQARCDGLVMQQVRKCNRKQFKGERSHIKNTAPRLISGYQRYDKVLYRGQECFIFGRRSSGYFDLRTLAGSKIHASAKVTNIKLLENASTILIERTSARTDA